MSRYLEIARQVVADARSAPETQTQYDINDINDQRSAPTADGWDRETQRLIDWFLTTSPPAEPFELCRGVTVLDPARWWRSIEGDIASGPNGPRARYGAVQGDLRRLHALMKTAGGIPL